MPPADPAPARPLRKDAQRSRQLVLDAARALFAERGLDVGFDEIARAAGVGVGTVYRRFPDRAALAAALFEEKIEDLIAAAQSAQAVEDPWESFLQLALVSIRLQQRDRGLLEVLASEAFGDPRLLELRDRAAAEVQTVVTRVQDAGLLREDLTAMDVVLMLHLFSRMSLADGTELWQRSLVLFLDAVRRREGQQPLPTPPLTFEDFEAIAHRL
ncbi:TetR/AcrR family transcriptional regulator [Nocardioides fonticola]|uniref:TetR/AcrR family transcriptional regulator n=1 Tax=Nocardioides fonticola TaxID=450363 RepID=A0ABP7XGH9_9ACTN